MRLKELRTGEVVTFRNGKTGMVIKGVGVPNCGLTEDLVIFPDGGWFVLDFRYISEDMVGKEDEGYSIDRVDYLENMYDIADFLRLKGVTIKRNNRWDRGTISVSMGMIRDMFGGRVKIIG